MLRGEWGRISTSMGRWNDHTYQFDEKSVYPLMWLGEGRAGPFNRSGGPVSPGVEWFHALQMFFPDAGQVVFNSFLLRDGLFMHMSMASLIVLLILCASLSTIVGTGHIYWVFCGLAVVLQGGSGSEIFLKPILKGPFQVPYVIF